MTVRRRSARESPRAEDFIDPATVRFTQASVGHDFRDGSNIDDMAEALRDGRLESKNVPPIRLVRCGNDLFTLDNRRLEAFRRAGIDVPVRMASQQEASDERWKLTTRNRGRSIRVRGG